MSDSRREFLTQLVGGAALGAVGATGKIVVATEEDLKRLGKPMTFTLPESAVVFQPLVWRDNDVAILSCLVAVACKSPAETESFKTELARLSEDSWKRNAGNAPELVTTVFPNWKYGVNFLDIRNAVAAEKEMDMLSD